MEDINLGAKISEAGKQYSVASSTALKKLNSIDRKFEGITHRIESVAALEAEVTQNMHDSITKMINAKNELAQIAGDLDRLQFRELDAVETAELNSGKIEAKSHRKSLNAAVETLMRRTQNLHNAFVSTIEKMKAGEYHDDLGIAAAPVVSKAEDTADSNDTTDSSPVSVATEKALMVPQENKSNNNKGWRNQRGKRRYYYKNKKDRSPRSDVDRSVPVRVGSASSTAIRVPIL